MNDYIPVITIYTDGACSNGLGGWAAYMSSQNQELHMAGNEADTTNNRMELTAVINSISQLSTCHQIELYSDSKYVLYGIEEGIKKWSLNGWKSSRGTDIENRDLWEKLKRLKSFHYINTHWVKGHAGIYGNCIVDELAQYLRQCPMTQVTDLLYTTNIYKYTSNQVYLQYLAYYCFSFIEVN